MKSDMCSRMMVAGAVVLLAGSAMAQMAGQQPSTGGTNSQQQMQNQAQMGSMQGSMSSNGASPQDKMFAKKALAGGMAEVQLGQLALTKSNSEDVKKFAQTMIDDHTKLNDQMKPIAAEIGVQPPAGLMPKDKKVLTMLQGLSGDDFDKAYIKDMLKDHKEDNRDFEMEASSGQFPAEKEAAMQGDQVIKTHLQMAEQLAQTHNVASK
jgi:putative membrane protein